MTATTSAVHAPERGHRELLTGTGLLLRLFLRISGRQVLVWTIAFAVLVAASVAALRDTYPDAEALQARAALLDNPAAVMMTGPAFALDDYTFGAMVANELALWILLPAGIMSVLLAVRLTRAEEESGRLEMVRSLPVGRLAPALAAVLTVTIADLAVGVAVSGALVATGMEVAGSLALGLATTLTGLVLGAVAAVTAQLTEHARTASALGLGVIAVALLVRGIGDVIDRQGSWLSWLSPFAWAQQTRAYVELRWWPLAVSALVTVLLLVLAAALARQRDLGAGLWTARPGPASASRALRTPAGLVSRLVSGTFLGWAVALFLFAVAFGTLATSLEGMVEDIPAVGEWIDLDLDDLTRSFAAVIVGLFAVGPLALAVSGILRLREEERAGRVEGLLASGSRRASLAASWAGVVAVGAVLVQVLVGLGTGIGVAVATGEAAWVGELTVAALAYVPAILLGGALALALHGLAPRLAGLAWALVLWVAVVAYLGSLLGLPGWARELSPLARTPAVPDATLTAAPLLVMTALAAVLTAAGLLGLRRRDVGTA